MKAGEVISEVTRKINKEKTASFSNRSEEYEIYGAKKSGKRKQDLPSIEHDQILKNTNIKRFYICPITEGREREECNELATEMKMTQKRK